MNKERIIRKITGTNKQIKINVPSEFGFTIDDYVEIIKESDNTFKVVKVDVIRKDVE